VVVQTFTVGAFQENCYLLVDDRTNRAVIVDPGGEGDRLVEAIDNSSAKLDAIWNYSRARGSRRRNRVGKEAVGRSDLSPSARPAPLRSGLAPSRSLRDSIRGATAARSANSPTVSHSTSAM